jgi:hypothetical protein
MADTNTPFDPYAAPSIDGAGAAPFVATADMPEGLRVGGLVRTFAAILSSLPMTGLTLFGAFTSAQILFTGGPVSPEQSPAVASYLLFMYAFSIGWGLLELGLQIGLGASVGMLLLGLRVGTVDAQPASLGKRIAKAVILDVAVLIAIPSALMRIVHPVDPTSVADARMLLDNGTGSVQQFIAFFWLIGCLFAFGPRKQTLFDRVLGLAVYRKRDLRELGHTG